MIKQVGFAQAMRVPALAGGTFSLVGARARAACEALRAKVHLSGFGSDYVGDAGCQPARLDIY